MADKISKKARSYTMSRIRAKNTTPEIIVRKFLFNKGFRYRIHSSTLPGKPDIVLAKYTTVIFVHGCFWHAHDNCKYNKLPKSRTEYWTPKILGNKERDKLHAKALRKLGWKVIVVWECQLKGSTAQLERLLRKHLPV